MLLKRPHFMLCFRLYCSDMDNKLSQVLLQLAMDLSKEGPPAERFNRLWARLRKIIDFDASAVLMMEGEELRIVSSTGLGPEAKARSYRLSENPRFKVMVETKMPVIFPAESTLPDPFDGLLEGDEKILHPVHSCLGCPLIVDNLVVGCLTLDALRLHAFDSLSQEFLETLGALAGAGLRTALLVQRLERESTLHMEWAKELQGLQVARDLIGESKPMQRLQKEIRLVAKSPFPVLILGETGTGKELVARLVHKQSPRADNTWIALNCASLPESLAESELFGHVRGAFTGADRDRPGKFELAHRGTLFLDEIGDLPLTLQAKLLRVLQEGEVQRLGSDTIQQVDVRIVAATNRDLVKMVEEGTFRRDLLHRLQVFPLHIPPLRERTQDIPLLVAACAQETSRELGYGLIRFAPKVIETWQGETWPGNVRELYNRVRYKILSLSLQPNEAASVEEDHYDNSLNSYLSFNNPNETLLTETKADLYSGLCFTDAVDEYKRKIIRKAIKTAQGNWSKAAEQLGLDRANLHRTAKRLGLHSKRNSAPPS